jgi:YfiH family protein
MNLTTRGRLEVLEFEAAAREGWPIRHGISTRGGGVSAGTYSSLNVGFRPGDEPANVVENRRRLCAAVAVPTDRFVSASLAHLANVRIIDSEELFGGFDVPGAGARGFDALITNMRGVTLFATSADCALTLLFDPLNVVLAVVHAGWQGAALNIHANVLRTMQLRFGSDPARVFAGIGPTVSAAFYDVPPARVNVLRSFYGNDLTASFCAERDGRYYLDVEKLILHQLRELGVRAIETSPFKTDRDEELLFSARKHGETGRQALVAAIAS